MVSTEGFIFPLRKERPKYKNFDVFGAKDRVYRLERPAPVRAVPFILAKDQLDAQFLYFIIRLLQSSTCFEQRRAHHQEVKFY